MIFARLTPHKPPREVLDVLQPDEPVVSWAQSPAGPVTVTRLGLWWPFAQGPRRLGFHLIDHAVWRDGQLIVTEAEVVDDLLLVDLAPVAVELTEPRNVPDALRKRVTQSVVRTEVLPVPGGAARIVARRVPGVDGLRWWARLEPGTPSTAAVRLVVRTLVDQLAAAHTGAASF